MYTVIGALQSRAFRVFWMLEELGVPYEQQSVKGGSEEALKHSYLGKIPVLLVDDTPITDSVAIITYLADKHEKFTYAAGTLERAKQDGFTQAICDDIDAILWTSARHSGELIPKDMRLPAIKDSLMWEFERNLGRITQQIKGPFLMGDKLTVPDILLAHCGGWAMGAGFPVNNPDYKAYLKNMRERESFKRLVAQIK